MSPRRILYFDAGLLRNGKRKGVSVSDEIPPQDMMNCYRIIWNFQDYGPKTVVEKLKAFFPNKTADEISELIIATKRKLVKG